MPKTVYYSRKGSAYEAYYYSSGVAERVYLIWDSLTDIYLYAQNNHYKIVRVD